MNHNNINHQLVVDTARNWLGTAFHHQGRLQKNKYHQGGCDCIGLIMGVADSLSLYSKKGVLLKAYDENFYHRMPDGKRLANELETHLHKVDTIELADILLFAFDHQPQHVGMVSYHAGENITMIHSYLKAKKVVEHRLDASWNDKLVGIYRLAGLS